MSIRRSLRLPKVEIVGPIADRWDALPRSWKIAGRVALLVFVYYLPLLKLPILDTPRSDFASVLFFPVSVYVLVAMGLNVVVGYAGLLDLGYVAFFAIGGYAMALLGVNHGWSFFEVLPVSILVSMTAGVILGTPTLRLRGDYLAIVTLGFGEMIRITARNTEALGAARGIFGIPHPPSMFGLKFGVIDPKPYYWMSVTLILLVIVVVRRLERSRVGRAWAAIREDEDAAELMGVPTFAFKLWAFAIGAGIGGMAGTVFASKVISITPDNFTLILSILFLAAVVLGGSGNLVGVIVGAIVVAYLPERFRGFAELRVLVFGAALVVMMIFRPQGLIPSRRRVAGLGTATPGNQMGAETAVELAVGDDA
ncbi:MAG: branched-chain amino acid transport system permease protein [Actinomycetota bacterium]|nr:branched-chain amino acid transport system permease protein [Actinomycetota bacterium]